MWYPEYAYYGKSRAMLSLTGKQNTFITYRLKIIIRLKFCQQILKTFSNL